MRPVPLLTLISISVSVSAHQATILTQVNGELEGLPEKYGNAKLEVKEQYLSVGRNRIDFPSCVSKYFLPKDDLNISVSASWYHSGSSLPPYLDIAIEPENRDFSYSLLFELDTLKPIKFEVLTFAGHAVMFHTISIHEHCLKSIKASTTKL